MPSLYPQSPSHGSDTESDYDVGPDFQVSPCCVIECPEGKNDWQRIQHTLQFLKTHRVDSDMWSDAIQQTLTPKLGKWIDPHAACAFLSTLVEGLRAAHCPVDDFAEILSGYCANFQKYLEDLRVIYSTKQYDPLLANVRALQGVMV